MKKLLIKNVEYRDHTIEFKIELDYSVERRINGKRLTLLTARVVTGNHGYQHSESCDTKIIAGYEIEFEARALKSLDLLIDGDEDSDELTTLLIGQGYKSVVHTTTPCDSWPEPSQDQQVRMGHSNNNDGVSK